MTFREILVTSGIYSFVATILLGLFVYFHNRKNPLNIFFGIFALTVGCWSLGSSLENMIEDETSALWTLRMCYLFAVILPSAFIQFTHILVEIPKERKWVVSSYCTSASLFPFVFSNLFIKRLQIIEPYHFRITEPGPVYYIFLSFFSIAAVRILLLMYQAAKDSTGVRRKQMQYIFIAHLVLVAAGFDYFASVLGFIKSPPLDDYLVLVYFLIFAYAVVKYRVMDISTVIHKTMMWLTISSLIMIPIAAIFYFGQNWMIRLSNLQRSLFVAALFASTIPYIKIIQPRIDHLFQRRKYDMQKILQGMIQELAALKNLESLINKMADTIQEVLYVSRTTVVLWNDSHQTFKIVKGEIAGVQAQMRLDTSFLHWMKEQDQVIELEEIDLNPRLESVRLIAHAYFKQFNAEIVLPLVHDNKLIGLINLGEKDNLKSFSKMDLDFLANLRAEASIALSNSLLYDDVSKMSEALRQWASELERKVEERTRELAESKKELEQSYQKLQELDALKSQFFANISHEFRTPLTLMLVPIDSVRQQEITAPTQIRRRLDVAYNNGLRLLKLINNLLDLAKLDSGKMVLRAQPVNIASFLRGIVEELSQIAEQRGITLSLAVQDLSLLVSLDSDKVEKVILNLLFNAIKFTPSGGKISVACQKEGEQLSISISDSGTGIPIGMQQKIFDRFYQVDSVSTRSHEGTGIGLAVAKELVELHGGTMAVKSAPHQGSIFTFTLPIQRAIDPVEGSSEWNIPEGFQSFSKEAAYNTADLITISDCLNSSFLSEGRPKILVVEDNADMRRFLLEKLGEYYEVLEAVNGEEGLKLAKDTLPDLILSDVMMPKQDGFQLCRELKNDPITASLPVMLLTAKADLSSKMEGFGVRADDYLVKPFNTEELLARVRTQIERRNSIKNLEEFLKTAQHQVQEANLLMIEMAHEIKNPVSFAKGNISLLSRAVEQAEQSGEWQEIFEEMRNSIQIIGAGLDRVSAIVGNVKQFLSPNLDNKISFSLTDTMKSTVNILSSPLEGKVKIHQEYKTNGVIEGVADQIHQLFLNLIKNAVEAMNGAGELKILITEEEGRFIVTIQDSGPGIPPETLPHLFDPFFTTKKEKGGSGLGLSICKKIVERHHGEIKLRNIQELGTEAKIFFPKTHK